MYADVSGTNMVPVKFNVAGTHCEAAPLIAIEGTATTLINDVVESWQPNWVVTIILTA